MALSLLLALFDINDEAALAQAAANNPNSPAGQYHGMSNDQKRRVMAALYDAFYTILGRVDELSLSYCLIQS
jgi:hypothetical protein